MNLGHGKGFLHGSIDWLGYVTVVSKYCWACKPWIDNNHSTQKRVVTFPWLLALLYRFRVCKGLLWRKREDKRKKSQWYVAWLLILLLLLRPSCAMCNNVPVLVYRSYFFQGPKLWLYFLLLHHIVLCRSRPLSMHKLKTRFHTHTHHMKQ